MVLRWKRPPIFRHTSGRFWSRGRRRPGRGIRAAVRLGRCLWLWLPLYGTNLIPRVARGASFGVHCHLERKEARDVASLPFLIEVAPLHQLTDAERVPLRPRLLAQQRRLRRSRLPRRGVLTAAPHRRCLPRASASAALRGRLRLSHRAAPLRSMPDGALLLRRRWAPADPCRAGAAPRRRLRLPQRTTPLRSMPSGAQLLHRRAHDDPRRRCFPQHASMSNGWGAARADRPPVSAKPFVVCVQASWGGSAPGVESPLIKS